MEYRSYMSTVCTTVRGVTTDEPTCVCKHGMGLYVCNQDAISCSSNDLFHDLYSALGRFSGLLGSILSLSAQYILFSKV